MSMSKSGVWFFVTLLVISLLLVLHLLSGFLAPVVLALVIVSIFYPMHQRILRMTGNRPNWAAFLSLMVIILCVLGPLGLFFASLTQQAYSFYQATEGLKGSGEIARWISSLNSYLAGVTKYLAGFGIHITTEPITDLAMSISQTLGNQIYDVLSGFMANLVSILFNFILMLVLVFIFFVNGKSAKNFVMDLVLIPQDEKEQLVSRFRDLASAVFLGNGLISILEGAIGGVLFFLFDIPGALIWAVFMSITAFLPVIGSSLIVIPASIYLFLVAQPWAAIAFAALNALQISILETVVKARFIGTKSHMHAVLVFLSIIAGVEIYGILGLFYGPLLVTIFLSLAQIYRERYRSNLLAKKI